MDRADKHVLPVANLREFFKDSVHGALEKQRVAVEEQTEQYVVNLLTLFARSEALYETTPEGPRLKPLALMLCDALEAPSVSAAQPRAAAARRRVAVHRGLLCARLRAHG